MFWGRPGVELLQVCRLIVDWCIRTVAKAGILRAQDAIQFPDQVQKFLPVLLRGYERAEFMNAIAISFIHNGTSKYRNPLTCWYVRHRTVLKSPAAH